MGQEYMPWVEILIIGLAILVILGGILYFYYLPNSNINFIYEWLPGGGGGSNAPEAIVLENAVQCSYYRCVNGCNSDQVKRLQYSENGNLFDCSQFCKAEWTDTGTIDGKICDDRAKAHPVVATVASSKGEKISLDKTVFSVCFEETDTCGSGFASAKYILIEKAAINKNTKTAKSCASSAGQSFPGFSTLVINQGSYKIWTTSHSILGNGETTFICRSSD